jgi:hypothetical protein
MKICAAGKPICGLMAASGIVAKFIRRRRDASKLRLWWSARDKSWHALAELDDEDISNLSEIGRQRRREAQQSRSGMPRPPARLIPR